MRNCNARQCSDQMSCHRCGYVWDTNDPDPPACKTDKELQIERGDIALNKIREMLESEVYIMK